MDMQINTARSNREAFAHIIHQQMSEYAQLRHVTLSVRYKLPKFFLLLADTDLVDVAQFFSTLAEKNLAIPCFAISPHLASVDLSPAQINNSLAVAFEGSTPSATLALCLKTLGSRGLQSLAWTSLAHTELAQQCDLHLFNSAEIYAPNESSLARLATLTQGLLFVAAWQDDDGLFERLEAYSQHLLDEPANHIAASLAAKQLRAAKNILVTQFNQSPIICDIAADIIHTVVRHTQVVARGHLTTSTLYTSQTPRSLCVVFCHLSDALQATQQAFLSFSTELLQAGHDILIFSNDDQVSSEVLSHLKSHPAVQIIYHPPAQNPMVHALMQLEALHHCVQLSGAH